MRRDYFIWHTLHWGRGGGSNGYDRGSGIGGALREGAGARASLFLFASVLRKKTSYRGDNSHILRGHIV